MTRYAPRGMPHRFMDGAPEIVRRSVIDLIRAPANDPCVCPFDVIFRPDGVAPAEIVGLDFDEHGARGCHFFMSPHAMRQYRERCRRRRVRWLDLPEPTRGAILAYLQET